MSIFQSLLTFFGLTSEYRVQIFKQIHEIVFHGKGGYDWHTIYNMPIWLRRYTFNEIKEFYEAEAKSSRPAPDQKSKLAFGPNIDPTYKSKASKK